MTFLIGRTVGVTGRWTKNGKKKRVAHVAAAAPRVPRQRLDTAGHRPGQVEEQSSATWDLIDAAVARKVPRNRWKEPEAQAALHECL